VEKRPVELDGEFGWRMPENYAASLFFLTNPNAPTSLRFPKSTVAKFAEGFEGVVVIDEAYVDFADEHCMDLASEHSNVIVARTLSKSYSLAGIRLGYCIGNADLIGALYKIKDSYNVDYLTQEIARAALRDQDTMRANVQAVVETRKLAASRLSELGFKVCDSQTNFLWIKPPRLPASVLFEELRKKDIIVRYFGENGKTGDYLRVTVGTAPEMFRFLDAVEEIVNV
jgi:histidinol-phosphate aminotransferase